MYFSYRSLLQWFCLIIKSNQGGKSNRAKRAQQQTYHRKCPVQENRRWRWPLKHFFFVLQRSASSFVWVYCLTFSSLRFSVICFLVEESVIAKRGYLTPSQAKEHVMQLWEKEGKTVSSTYMHPHWHIFFKWSLIDPFFWCSWIQLVLLKESLCWFWKIIWSWV